MRISRWVLAIAVLALLLAAAARNLAWSDSAPRVPHAISGHVDCLSCHGPGSEKPYPEEHQGRELPCLPQH
jgi:cytochrome c553